jgi:DUF971 family protein
MTPPLQPTAIQKIGTELAIAWNDSSESYLSLEFLRRHCPCAACGGEPDVLGQVALPSVTYNERSFDLTSWQTVGGYAIQPRWADGHSTGLYAYKFLRRLEHLTQS